MVVQSSPAAKTKAALPVLALSAAKKPAVETVSDAQKIDALHGPVLVEAPHGAEIAQKLLSGPLEFCVTSLVPLAVYSTPSASALLQGRSKMATLQTQATVQAYPRGQLAPPRAYRVLAAPQRWRGCPAAMGICRGVRFKARWSSIRVALAFAEALDV
jgi:hypothetical protein